MDAVVNHYARLIDEDKGHFCLAADENLGTIFEETRKHGLLNNLKKGPSICAKVNIGSKYQGKPSFINMKQTRKK